MDGLAGPAHELPELLAAIAAPDVVAAFGDTQYYNRFPAWGGDGLAIRFQAAYRADDDAVRTLVGEVACCSQDHLERHVALSRRVDQAGKGVQGFRPFRHKGFAAELDFDQSACSVPQMNDRIAFQPVSIQGGLGPRGYKWRDRLSHKLRISRVLRD